MRNLYKKNMIMSFISYIAIVAINYFSALGFINGMSQSAVSKSYPTMITPAGYAFSIWGVIYGFILIALLVTAVRKDNINIDGLNGIAFLFFISAIINIAWTFAFAYEMIWLSAILIVILLINIVMILIRLDSIRGSKKGLYDIGFGLYAGWLAIASVVNFSAFLVSIGFKFFNNPMIFYPSILLVFIIAMVLLSRVHRNPFFNLSIIWAFIGIIVKQQFTSYTNLLFIVLVLGIIVLAVNLVMTISNMKSNKYR